MAKILVIEDDPQSARLVRRVLENHGHEVVHAAEGLSGLKIASQGDVNLVLLDLNLPDISGHTIAALLHRIPGNIPVIAVTASADTVSERRALAYGCAGYITKPIDTRLFPDQINAFLAPSPEPNHAAEAQSTDSAAPPASPSAPAAPAA